ncbi:metalloregulator ArsR/SmtB family transcription factor [Mycobacterium tuberculosis]|nr:metalloregulator ArsR/SmtB family transcription factor [Mycobacterium tuberculosis]
MESEPLYKLKAEFFKTLAHPARIRILELLVERDRSVGELLSSDVGLESSNLSQQLGVLRRAGVVAARRDGNAMIYSIAAPDIAELLAVARKVLARVLSDRVAVLEDLRAETDAAHAVAIVHTDYVAQVSLLTHLAAAMRTAGRGSLVVFSSVAGIRVRRANYVYGSAKAGLDGFASGLADALHGTGVRLLIARPGFVIGRMTEGMTPAPLSVTPERVAAATARALVNGKRVVWIPWALRPMFVALRLLPRFVWRRMPR